MARGDNRRTSKFQARRGQRKLKARLKRRAEATKAARKGRPAASPSVKTRATT